jgi:hypothetical protein
MCLIPGHKETDVETTVHRLDPKLTEMAKNIFGADLIEAAYVATWAYPECTPQEIGERLDWKTFQEVTEVVDCGDTEIVLEFCNGKTVSIKSSEVGFIKATQGLNIA